MQKGESHFVIVDIIHDFFKRNTPACFLAEIKFTDSYLGGDVFSYLVPISLEERKWKLDHINERLRAEFEICKIPEKLDDLKSRLEEMNRLKSNEIEILNRRYPIDE